MENNFSTLGYGLLFDETIQLLNSALNIQDVKELRKTCIKLWPQKSEANKERIWRHIKFRFLEINNDKVVLSPFLGFFQKINNDNVSVKDLHFFQLCIKTPILYETLSSLISESFINTGEAHFSNYHLNQLLEKKYKRIPSSTKNRLLSIMIKSKRLKVDKSNYSVIAYCPNEAVLGYGLYHDSLKNGWRSPSSATIIND